MRGDEPPFAHLAASQIGYAPSMRKQFTAPRKFSSFRVVREGDGSTALQGAGPVRRLETEILGRDPLGCQSATSPRSRRRGATTSSTTSAKPAFLPDRPRRLRSRGARRAALVLLPARLHRDRAEACRRPLVPRQRRRQGAARACARGWHDAGDFSLYSTSLNTALYWLLETWQRFRARRQTTPTSPSRATAFPICSTRRAGGWSGCSRCRTPRAASATRTCEEHYRAYGRNTSRSARPTSAGEVGTLATARAVGNLAVRLHPLPALRSGLRRAMPAGGPRRLPRISEAHPGENTDGPTCPAARAGRQRGDRQARAHVRGRRNAARHLGDVLPGRLRAELPGADVRPELPAHERVRRAALPARRRPAIRRAKRRSAERVARARGRRSGRRRASIRSSSPPATIGGPSAPASPGRGRTASGGAWRTRPGRAPTASRRSPTSITCSAAITSRSPTSAGCPEPRAARATPSITGWRPFRRAVLLSRAWSPEGRTPTGGGRHLQAVRPGPSRSGVTGAIPPFRATRRPRWKGAIPTTTAGPPTRSTSTGRRRRSTTCISPDGSPGRSAAALSRRGKIAADALLPRPGAPFPAPAVCPKAPPPVPLPLVSRGKPVRSNGKWRRPSTTGSIATSAAGGR